MRYVHSTITIESEHNIVLERNRLHIKGGQTVIIIMKRIMMSLIIKNVIRRFAIVMIRLIAMTTHSERTHFKT